MLFRLKCLHVVSSGPHLGHYKHAALPESSLCCYTLTIQHHCRVPGFAASQGCIQGVDPATGADLSI